MLDCLLALRMAHGASHTNYSNDFMFTSNQTENNLNWQKRSSTCKILT